MACGGCGNKSNDTGSFRFKKNQKTGTSPQGLIFGNVAVTSNNNIQNNLDHEDIIRPKFEKASEDRLKNMKQIPVQNLITAAKSQKQPFKWFRDGLNGIIKCLNSETIYSDEDIQKNRDACRECEFSTKNEKGDLNMKSQCMGPDPKLNNAPCGCFLLCKTQSGHCPLNKWSTTPITISGK